MANILVIGATGYIGGRLVPRLLRGGHRVRCLVRNPLKTRARDWPGAEVVRGNVLEESSLPPAFEGIDIAYYLVHSMADKDGDFGELDRAAARNTVGCARGAGVERLIYLGGLGRREKETSDHLGSRHEVGDVLRAGGVPVTEFRAAAIIGSGSASFEIVHHLVNRLPVMICPSWVRTRTQPIGVADVLAYLVEAAENPASSGKVIDIGGPDIVTYGEMMDTTAHVLGLKRHIVYVPFLTPRLSSYWVSLFTPVPYRMARLLAESLRQETVCENDLARRLFDIEPEPFRQTVVNALEHVRSSRVETRWSDASREFVAGRSDHSIICEYTVTKRADVGADRLFDPIRRIGGDSGWYYWSRAWNVRGGVDKLIGGVGLRRGRRSAVDLRVGESLDFWRVVEFEENRLLVLEAEMRLPGKAWLAFEVEEDGERASGLTLQARYYPRGLTGYLYWYVLYPFHAVIFEGLAGAIIRRAGR